MDWYENNLLFDATPDLMVQYSTLHMGKVVDVKDPEGRGRVRLLVPGLLGIGKENWSDWVEVTGTAIGGIKKSEGDQGIWWPLEPGQLVLMGFVSGDPFAYFCIPGPPCQKEDKDGTQLTPKEAKIAAKKDAREGARVRTIKTEAGHTILFDDRGKSEKMAVIDWTGAGLFSACAGKTEDEKEQEGDESKERKGARRGTKMVATGTSKGPQEIMKDGYHILRLCDLNGGGAIWFAKDGAGMAGMFAASENGSIGPSALFDAQKDNLYLTAGDQQIQILGEEGLIAMTHPMIMEREKIPVEDAIEMMVEAMKDAFKEFDE